MHICINFIGSYNANAWISDYIQSNEKFRANVSEIKTFEWNTNVSFRKKKERKMLSSNRRPLHPRGNVLTHWGQLTHICISKVIIIGSDNGLLPSRCQAIIWTNAGMLLIGPLGTNFNEILIEIHTFSFKKIPFKMSSGKWRSFCLCLNV